MPTKAISTLRSPPQPRLTDNAHENRHEPDRPSTNGPHQCPEVHPPRVPFPARSTAGPSQRSSSGVVHRRICVEILFTSWPSIPEPIEQNEQPTQLPTSASQLETVPLVQIYLHPQDIKPLARTLKQDVIRHGGSVIRGNDETHKWTFAVSQQYLTRIQPLIDASSVRPPGRSYREWARNVYANPKDSKITGPANVAVTFQFRHPWFSRAANMWATIAAGIMAGCAILTMPAMLILPRLFPHRYGQAVRFTTQPPSKD